jgi:immune inhibitor A
VRRRIVTDDPKPVNSARRVAHAPHGRRVSTRAALAFFALLVYGPAAAAPREVPVRGDLRLVVILAGFADRPLDLPRGHFIGEPTSLLDRLVAYYTEVSAGRLHIVPVVVGPVVTLPSPRASYVQRPRAMAADAVESLSAAARDPADLAALRDAHALVVFFAGTGRESHTATPEPNDPWSNYAALVPPVEPRDVAPFEEAIVIAAEQVSPFSSFGVLCHEFGHLLGLPELYAPGGLPQEGIGVWGLMGQGTWLGRGTRPPHLSAWEKLRLGWVEVQDIGATTVRVRLPSADVEPRVVRIAATPENAHEYYLLENRRRIGADERIPGEGLLVWHVDERVGGFRTAQTDAGHKLLHLVEADGRGDLDRGHAAGGNRGDPTDPWAGPRPWRRYAGAILALAGAVLVAAAILRAVRPRPLLRVLGLLVVAAGLLATAAALRGAPVCGPGTPGMAPYDGGPARVVIRNISPAGPVMHFDVLMAPD